MLGWRVPKTGAAALAAGLGWVVLVAAAEGTTAEGTTAQGTTAQVVIAAHGSLGRPVVELAPGEISLREEGEEVAVLSVEPLIPSGGAAPPLRVLVYVDGPLLTVRSRFRAADALAERAPELTALGPVAVLTTGRSVAELRLRPTRDPKLVAGVLAAVAREGGGGDLARLRSRALARLPRLEAGEEASQGFEALRERLLAAAGREQALVEERIDRLRQGLAGFAGEGPGLLVWLADGFDLDPAPFYLQGFPEGPLRLALEDNLRLHAPATAVEVLAPYLAAAGWTALPLSFRAGPAAGGRPVDELLLAPQEPLRELARATAGLVVPDARALSPALAELASRWRLTYRRLQARLAPPRLEAVSRRGGLALQAPRWGRSDDAFSRAGERALALFGPWAPAGSLDLGCRLYRQGGADSRHVLLRCITVAGKAADHLPGSQGELWMTVLARSGGSPPEPVARLHLPLDPRLRLRSRLPLEVSFRLPPAAEELAVGVVGESEEGEVWGAARLAVPWASPQAPGPQTPESRASEPRPQDWPGGGPGPKTQAPRPEGRGPTPGPKTQAPRPEGRGPTPGPKPQDPRPAGRGPDPVATVAESLAWLPEESSPLYLVPPQAPVVVGRTRVVAQVTRREVARVTFQLDGRQVASDAEAPFEAWIPLPLLPEPHTIRATAHDGEGRLLGVDSFTVNRSRALPRVRIVEPRTLPGPGEYEVRLEVDVPPRSRLRSLELYWNEERLARFEAPPYRARLTLPAGTAAGYLRAAAALEDGATAEDVLTLGQESFSSHVAVDLVELFPVVRDRHGKPVPDLTREEIELLENGEPREIHHFARGADEPLTVGLVLDVSGSVIEDLPLIQQAARRFLREVLRPGDRAFLVAFADEPYLLLRPTGELESLAEKIGWLEAGGGTALYDTTAFSLLQLAGVAGRKAVVLLTDGDDTASHLTYQECLLFARRSGIPLYLVGLGSLGSSLSFPHRIRMLRLARATGADLHLVDRAEVLEETYAAIARELRSQYLVTFSPEPGTEEGWRPVEVKVRRPGVEVRSAAGYYARGREP